ncbi:MAG: hypothetical protein ACI3XJ_08375 [Oscillospiraceae bacterium]
MKHITRMLALLLGLFLLASCTSQGQSYCPPAEEPDVSPAGCTEDGTTDLVGPVDGPPWFATFRIVDGAETGSLLLAENDGSAGAVYTLNVNKMPLDFTPRDGQLINVYFETILETYPAQFQGVSAVELTKAPVNDRCGLYLQVLEDLWNVDPGLNTGITELGVDLSRLTDLTESEKAAVAWRFGELHGLFPIVGTWEELCEQGYIDREHLFWEDGCLFSLTGSAEGVFDAEKWRNGTGAYYFSDCSAQMAEDGTWTYTVGSEVIS